MSTVTAFECSNRKWRDRLIAQVCDPFWVLVRWELSPDMIARAEAALGSEWHQAQPVIRVYDVTSSDKTNAMNRWVRDVEIRGGLDHWYIPVDDSDRSYQLHIGYITSGGRFFALAHSKSVRTSRDMTSRQSYNRKNGKPQVGSPVPRSQMMEMESGFHIDAELVVMGVTHPQARLTFSGIPVDLAEDGSFQFRMALPNGRQLFPAVMVTPCGGEEHTIVLAVERNTKALGPKTVEED